ncbi:MAG: hypothetical protein ACLT63_16625 [Bacteroides xylanisolvens]
MAQAKSVYIAQASIPQLEAGINQYITTLAVLLGMYPQDIRPVLESSGTLPITWNRSEWGYLSICY